MALFNTIKKKLEKPSPKKEFVGKKNKPLHKKTLTEDKKMDPAKAIKKKDDTHTVTASKTKKNISKLADCAHVLLNPLVTEKSAHLGSDGKYMFRVSPHTNKIEIKKAVQALYEITPTQVHIQNTTGKKVRHGKSTGQRINTKKAIITLPKGKTIEIYEGT
jgi:large subunit ribosomal protein L23